MLLSMSLAGDAKSSDGNTPKENPVATNSWRMCTHIVNCGHELPKKGAEMTLAGPIPVAASPKTSQQGIPAVFYQLHLSRGAPIGMMTEETILALCVTPKGCEYSQELGIPAKSTLDPGSKFGMLNNKRQPCIIYKAACAAESC